MTVHRFIVEARCISEAEGFVKFDDPKQVRQLTRVLRLSKNSSIDVLDDVGNLYRCVIEELTGHYVTARIESARGGKSESASSLLPSCADGTSAPRLRVLLPLIQSNRFALALQKLTELGIDEIVPFQSARSVVRITGDPRGEIENKVKRWMSIIREATEQCERLRTPRVVAPCDFDAALADLAPIDQCAPAYLLVSRSEAPHLIHRLKGLAPEGCSEAKLPSDISVIIGPEGGFDAREIDKALSLGCLECTLGENILRSETAAIMSASILSSIGEIL